LFQRLAGGEVVSFHHDAGVGILIRDLRAAETPSGAGGHVHAHVEPVRLADRPAHHVHPFRRKVFNVFRFKTLCAVNRDDVDAAQPGGGVAFQFFREIGLVHRAAHPPVERPRLGLRRDGRPCQRILGGRGEN